MHASFIFQRLSPALRVTHLDLSTHQEHGCGSADGGGVECLQVVDHVSDGINALKRKKGVG
jgi:hypothetical protein